MLCFRHNNHGRTLPAPWEGKKSHYLLWVHVALCILLPQVILFGPIYKRKVFVYINMQDMAMCWLTFLKSYFVEYCVFEEIRLEGAEGSVTIQGCVTQFLFKNNMS